MKQDITYKATVYFLNELSHYITCKSSLFKLLFSKPLVNKLKHAE